MDSCGRATPGKMCPLQLSHLHPRRWVHLPQLRVGKRCLPARIFGGTHYESRAPQTSRRCGPASTPDRYRSQTPPRRPQQATSQKHLYHVNRKITPLTPLETKLPAGAARAGSTQPGAEPPSPHNTRSQQGAEGRRGIIGAGYAI